MRLIHILEFNLRKIRRSLSRSEWSLRFLGLPKGAASTERGLVLIQIDGLSRTQLEKALKRGQMPFLRKLQKREGYRLRTIYSGIPSTTAAAQAELFYGVPGAVPAYAYRERKSGRYMKMLMPECALRVEMDSAAKGEGILAGGSAYSNLYSGGAAESHFCASGLGAGTLLKHANPLGFLAVLVWNIGSLVRLLGLLALEFVVACSDSVRGAIARHEIRQELLFVFSRVLVCVGLRELITVEACMDVARSLPIVHVNYVGYDEQAHRRGPSSKFAHFSLRGIDNCIQRLWKAAHRADRRDYDVWIYSDHGQESAVPYARENHRTLDEAVAEVLGKPVNASEALRKTPRVRSEQTFGNRAESYLLRRTGSGGTEVKQDDQSSTVIAVGPFGHIYLPDNLAEDARISMARKLVAVAKIPMVLFPEGPDKAMAFTPAGQFELPRDAVKVLGAAHPFPQECAQDLVKACHHVNAGDFVISGWRVHDRPITFVWENGAHGGPGFEETRAFGLFPLSAPIFDTGTPLRYAHIREAAKHLRGQRSASVTYPPSARKTEVRNSLRVMTYNVHGCAGMDGKVSTSRIARVIAQYDPDLVALQECYGDIKGAQLQAIAKELQETYLYPADMDMQQDEYGNAILSMHPMQFIKAGDLPTLQGQAKEIRGAIWVTVEALGTRFHLVNTHLGLFSLERQKQVGALLGEQWLGGIPGGTPTVLLGDFNAVPSSAVFRTLTENLYCAQESAEGHKTRNTFPGRYPVSRIDHVFCSREIKIVQAQVPRTHLARLASDHLPLIVEIEARPIL